jgi:Rps23 Pro-64 3,4-dihydroxylase Tpa1-like proline 4-hydroxylase
MSWTNNEQSIINLINKKYQLDLKLSEDGFSHFDAYNDDLIAEIKIRKFESYHKFAKDGCFLEKYKYDQLCKFKKNRKMLYINGFKDSVIAVWDLQRQKYNWEVRTMKKQTFGYQNQQIEKEVCRLYLDTAFKFRGADV